MRKIRVTNKRELTSFIYNYLDQCDARGISYLNDYLHKRTAIYHKHFCLE